MIMLMCCATPTEHTALTASANRVFIFIAISFIAVKTHDYFSQFRLKSRQVFTKISHYFKHPRTINTPTFRACATAFGLLSLIFNP